MRIGICYPYLLACYKGDTLLCVRTGQPVVQVSCAQWQKAAWLCFL